MEGVVVDRYRGEGGWNWGIPKIDQLDLEKDEDDR